MRTEPIWMVVSTPTDVQLRDFPKYLSHTEVLGPVSNGINEGV
jgi:hypothetical protein